MPSPKLPLFSLTLLFTVLAAAAAAAAAAQIPDESSLQISTDTLDQWAAGISLPGEEFGDGIEEDFTIEGDDGPNRRSLLWRRVIHYYISYGALSANRIPCPPRSGRSYYTHNCYRARGPVHPYTRGCSAITRCRR